jgi:hypothetical protein
MLDQNQDILQLRFQGNDISPDKVKPSQIASLIEQFEKAILATITLQHPEINTEKVLFVFDSIKNESLGLNFKPLIDNILPDIKNAVVSSYVIIASSLNTNDYSKLPSDTIQSLKKIAAFSKENNCVGNFNLNGETIGTINPDTEIKEIKKVIVKSSLNIYGEIVDIGSNIHIKLDEGYTVIVDADKATSKLLAPRLWEYVGLKGNAKWDIETFKIIEFKLVEILEYNPGILSNVFKELKEIPTGWDKFNNNNEINKQLLRD